MSKTRIRLSDAVKKKGRTNIARLVQEKQRRDKVAKSAPDAQPDNSGGRLRRR